MNPPAGGVYRAVVPYAATPPYRLYAEAGPPLDVATTQAMVKGGQEVTMLVPHKPRPVLIVTEPVAPFNDVLALRLRRLLKFSEEQQKAIREAEDPAVFYLKPDAFPGLGEEAGVVLPTLTRLPLSAVDVGGPLGSLDENELRVIHERLLRLHDFDIRGLVMEKAKQLLAAVRSKKS